MAVRCLIVDDDDRFLTVARELLERDRISVVGVATTSAVAIRLMVERRPDLMLIDINLREESGFDLVAAIAGRHGTEQPILVLISTYHLDDYMDVPLVSTTPFLHKSDLSGNTLRRILAEARNEPG